MVIDHIGYAVKKTEKAIKDFTGLGFVFEDTIHDRDRNVFITFGQKDGYRIELVAPDGNAPSPVDEYLSKNGAIPYHICYRSREFEKDLENLQKEKYKLVIPPSPACALGGVRVAFLMKLSMGLVELAEE